MSTDPCDAFAVRRARYAAYEQACAVSLAALRRYHVRPCEERWRDLQAAIRQVEAVYDAWERALEEMEVTP